jgi:hypothetical protein
MIAPEKIMSQSSPAPPRGDALRLAFTVVLLIDITCADDVSPGNGKKALRAILVGGALPSDCVAVANRR